MRRERTVLRLRCDYFCLLDSIDNIKAIVLEECGKNAGLVIHHRRTDLIARDHLILRIIA